MNAPIRATNRFKDRQGVCLCVHFVSSVDGSARARLLDTTRLRMHSYNKATTQAGPRCGNNSVTNEHSK